MTTVGEKLRDIVASEGLGVAILVAWLHGLQIGHIPLERDSEGRPLAQQAEKTDAEPASSAFLFVRIPIRRIRRDNQELIRLGIMNKKADPVDFIYHEDGLVGPFTFLKLATDGVKLGDIGEILDALAQGRFLIRANINNRQIQFKDLDSKRFIDSSREPIYITSEESIVRLQEGMIPSRFDNAGVRHSLKNNLLYKNPCNYCSVHALNPREATIHSANLKASTGPCGNALDITRNY